MNFSSMKLLEGRRRNSGTILWIGFFLLSTSLELKGFHDFHVLFFNYLTQTYSSYNRTFFCVVFPNMTCFTLLFNEIGSTLSLKIELCFIGNNLLFYSCYLWRPSWVLIVFLFYICKTHAIVDLETHEGFI